MRKENYVIYGKETEVKDFQRVLEFGDAKNVERAYNQLIPAYKKIVDDALTNLIGDEDYFGFNLGQFLSDYKEAKPSVSKWTLAGAITYAIYDDEELDSRISPPTRLSYNNINNLIIKYDDADSIKYEKTIEMICKQFMVSQDVFKKGVGKIKVIKKEYMQDYLENDKFQENYALDYEFTDKWTTEDYIQCYEEHLRNEDKLSEEESILEEYWVVIKKSGAYRLLVDNPKREKELNAINQLISDLYAEQLVSGRMPNIQFEENVN